MGYSFNLTEPKRYNQHNLKPGNKLLNMRYHSPCTRSTKGPQHWLGSFTYCTSNLEINQLAIPGKARFWGLGINDILISDINYIFPLANPCLTQRTKLKVTMGCDHKEIPRKLWCIFNTNRCWFRFWSFFFSHSIFKRKDFTIGSTSFRAKG